MKQRMICAAVLLVLLLTGCGPRYEHPYPLNADRIRAMSDEELATNMMCPNENGLAEIECDKNDNCNCYECLLKWLQSEVEE